MFKFDGLKSLPVDVRIIYFTVSMYRNKVLYGFYINSYSSDKFSLSKSQFMKFHAEIVKENVLFEDNIFVYDEIF